MEVLRSKGRILVCRKDRTKIYFTKFFFLFGCFDFKLKTESFFWCSDLNVHVTVILCVTKKKYEKQENVMKDAEPITCYRT